MNFNLQHVDAPEVWRSTSLAVRRDQSRAFWHSLGNFKFTASNLGWRTYIDDSVSSAELLRVWFRSLRRRR